MIGDDVEIGANTTIDRGALDDTVIEDGVKLDNQIQIGHNCRIGAHTAIAGCVGIAGSTDDRPPLHASAARAMILGHLRSAIDVHVSAGTVISRSIRKPGTYTGHVSRSTNNASWARNAALVRHLAELMERVRALEKRRSRRARRRQMAEMDIQEILEYLPHRYPVPADRPGAGVRAGQAHRRAEERVGERAVFPGPLSRTTRSCRAC